MTDGNHNSKPRPREFLATIRRLAAVRAIRYSFHAEEERMLERDFDTEDVIETLEKGELKGDIEPGKQPGEWKAKLIHQPFGTRRWMGVVTVIIRNEYIRIVTTEWEDRR